MKELYPNKVIKKTGKSVFDIQREWAIKEIHKKEGIAFYCFKRNEYLFIPNVKYQKQCQ